MLVLTLQFSVLVREVINSSCTELTHCRSACVRVRELLWSSLLPEEVCIMLQTLF